MVESIPYARRVHAENGPGLLEKCFVGLVTAVGFTAAYFGGIALFIWALALLNEHWGIFWASVGFFTVFFAFVVVVMCFFWGVPYFFLAFLTWVSAICAMTSIDRSKKSAALALCAVLAFGGAGGYMAWKDAVTPDPITARDMDRLTDDAVAVIAILRSTQDTDNAEAAVASTRAKGRLRDELREYDVSRLDTIEMMVGHFLRFEKAVERDIVDFMERRVNGEQVEFEMGSSTRAAIDAMPERLQGVFSDATDDFEALNMLFNDRDIEDIPDDWREMMNLSVKKRWKDYGAAYADVMGRPMPMPK